MIAQEKPNITITAIWVSYNYCLDEEFDSISTLAYAQFDTEM